MIKSHIYSLNGRTVVPVTNSSGFGTAISNAQAGQVIELADGTYSGSFTLNADGTEADPIIIRSANPQGARFTGGATFEVRGRFVYLEGFDFDDYQIHINDTDNCRVTRCLFRDNDISRPLFSEHSHECRYDHNEFTNLDKRNLSVRGQESGGLHTARDCLIDWNYFHDSDQNVVNTTEPLQLINAVHDNGTDMGALAEFNLFENTINDGEVVSIKSSGNIFQFNTLLNCGNQTITCRHGNDNIVQGNTLNNSGRIRVFDVGHQILGNELKNHAGQNEIRVHAGNKSSHEVADDCVVVGNICDEIDIGHTAEGSIDVHGCHVVDNGNAVVNLLEETNTDQTTSFTGTVPTPVELTPAQVGLNAHDPRETIVTLTMDIEEGDILGPDPFSWLVTLDPDDDDVEWLVDGVVVLHETSAPYGNSITERVGFEGWNDPASYGEGPHVMTVRKINSGESNTVNVTMVVPEPPSNGLMTQDRKSVV